MKVGELYAALRLDSGPFASGLRGAESRARAFGGRIAGVFKGLAVTVAATLAVATAAAVTLGLKALQSASNLEQSVGAVETVFGHASSVIEEFGRTAARSFGLSRREVNETAAVVGAQLQSMGLDASEAADQTINLQQRAADMAATFGGKTRDALDAVSALLRGERDPIERYGVSIKQVDVNARIAALGLDTSTAAAKKNAEMTAALSLLYEQTAKTQGQFARESGTVAVMQQQVGVTFENTMAAIGKAVLPIAAAVLPHVLEAAERFGEWVEVNMPAIQSRVGGAFGVIGDVVSYLVENVWPRLQESFALFAQYVIPPLVAAVMFFVEEVWPRLQDAFRQAAETAVPMIASAVGWLSENVVPALSAAFAFVADEVVPAVVAAFQWVSEEVVPRLVAVFGAAVGWVSDNWPTISSIVGQVAGAVSGAFGVIASVIGAVWPIVEAVAKVLFPVVGAAATVLFNAIDGAFKLIGGVFEVFGTIAETIFEAVTGIWEGLGEFFGGVLDDVSGAFKSGLNVVIDVINGFIGFLNGIRIDIPEVTIPGLDVTFGGGAIDPFDISTISHLARGVRGFRGGYAIVGEQGPELLELPLGANVYTAGQTRSMLDGEGRVEVVIRDPDGAIARGGYDKREIAQMITEGMRSLVRGAQHRSLRMGTP